MTYVSAPHVEYSQMPDESLLIAYAALSEACSHAQRELGRIEQTLLQRIEERGATAIPDETYRCEVVTTNTYDQASLTPLLELFNQDELSSCYQPAYEEKVTVPAKWRTQQVIAAAKRRGTEALAIVERARIPGARRLVFKRREEV